MQTKVQYPMSYFRSLGTPRAMFAGRRTLNWFQLIFTFIFLVSLMAMPITLQIASQTTINLEQMSPHVFDMLDDSALPIVQHAQVDGYRLVGERNEVRTAQGIVAGWLTEAQVTDLLAQDQATLLFSDDGFTVKYPHNGAWRQFSVPYHDPASIQRATDVPALKASLSKHWFVANRPYAVGLLIVTSVAILFINSLFIWLGSGVLLWVARRAKIYHLSTYKECLNLILNCMGISTMVSVLYGLAFQAESSAMLTVQGIITVLLLTWVFFKTHFRDPQDATAQKQ